MKPDETDGHGLPEDCQTCRGKIMSEVSDESAADFFSTSRASHEVREVWAGSKKKMKRLIFNNCLLASSLATLHYLISTFIYSALLSSAVANGRALKQ
jgi:hypothetical protein